MTQPLKPGAEQAWFWAVQGLAGLGNIWATTLQFFGPPPEVVADALDHNVTAFLGVLMRCGGMPEEYHARGGKVAP
jgi:hypothetical protein